MFAQSAAFLFPFSGNSNKPLYFEVALNGVVSQTGANDFVLETLFRSRMATHERRMRLQDGAAYKALSPYMLPSLVAWFAFAKSNMAAAEGSNMIDFPLAAFALYVDKVQVDKWVFHQAEMAANKNRFLERPASNLSGELLHLKAVFRDNFI
jgi:hypothetical protein